MLSMILAEASNIMSGVESQYTSNGGTDTVTVIRDMENLIYPIIIGSYIFFNMVRRAIGKIKENENIEKIKNNNYEKMKKKKKFGDFVYNESMHFTLNMKNICNHYRDIATPDRVHFLQIENGTIAINGVHNMYITCIAEDDRYSRFPRVFPVINRIPYNRLSPLFEKMIIMQSYDNRVIEINTSKPDDEYLLGIMNEVYKTKIGSSLALPVYDNDSLFIGCVIFDYLDPDFNGHNIVRQKDTIKEAQVAINTMVMSYGVSLRAKRKELGLAPTQELHIDRNEEL